MAERLAENAHDMWAKSAKEESKALGGCIHPQMVGLWLLNHLLIESCLQVPYDLLTDREKKKNRERSQELLKFLQFEGFKVYLYCPHILFPVILLCLSIDQKRDQWHR